MRTIKTSGELPAGAGKFPPVTRRDRRQSVPAEIFACIRRYFYLQISLPAAFVLQCNHTRQHLIFGSSLRETFNITEVNYHQWSSNWVSTFGGNYSANSKTFRALFKFIFFSFSKHFWCSTSASTFSFPVLHFFSSFYPISFVPNYLWKCWSLEYSILDEISVNVKLVT